MKIINDYIQTLIDLEVEDGYILISQREWDELMDGEEYVGPIIKDYGACRVTIEIEDGE